MLTEILAVTGLLAAAGVFGSMLFFSAIVAPLVFIRLEAATAGRFIRGLFPWYYLFVLMLAAIAAAATVADDPLVASIMAAIAIGALIARQVLMPQINRDRDKALAGDDGADRRFARLHRLSVWINAAQIIAAVVALARLALL